MRIDVYIDNVWTNMITDNPSRILPYFMGDLVAEVPGAKYVWKFKSGEWDGRVQLFQVRGNDIAFRTGLIETVLGRLISHGFGPHIVIHPPIVPGVRPVWSYSGTAVPLRNYQRDVVDKADGHHLHVGPNSWPYRRGVLQVATGGGKTEIAVAMVQRHPVKTMFLVHRKDLLYQAKERFEKYKIGCNIIGDGQCRVNKGSMVTVATMQTLSRHLQDSAAEYYTDIMNEVRSSRQVFFDEAHLMASSLDKGNEFVNMADKFVHADSRWGLTATPFYRTQYDNLLLEGVTGALICQIGNAELIEQGHLTPPRVVMKKVPGTLQVTAPKWKPGNTKAGGKYWRDVEDLGIKFNVIRNKLIVDEMKNGPFPCLVLCKTTEQAEMIQKLYHTDMGLTTPLLTGKTSAKQRRQAIADLRSGALRVIIATTIFDEGVDIPELSKVILASGGKSRVKQLQRAGRGLRTAPGKEEVTIIDFQDTHHSLLKKHALERYNAWKEEEFAIVMEK